jgi:beta-galactosidase
MLDVIGQNYRENELLAAHEARPQRKILGTETNHDRQAWLAMRDHPPLAGQFLWAGIDYLGESPGWPAISADFGLLDRTGEFKPRAYQRQSWWSSEPMVRIVRRVTGTADASGSDEGAPRPAQARFADWTPDDAGPHTESVEVYSNCEQVELALNGQFLGSKAKPADDAPRVWEVRFAPGRIAATCRNAGVVKATDELRTAGQAVKIQFTADRTNLKPGWDNVAFLSATVMDARGVPVPRASNRISFQVVGPGVVAAVDNADLASHEPFQAVARSSFRGRCVAFIRATGTGPIKVTASSPGLSSSTVMVEGQ